MRSSTNPFGIDLDSILKSEKGAKSPKYKEGMSALSETNPNAMNDMKSPLKRTAEEAKLETEAPAATETPATTETPVARLDSAQYLEIYIY